MKKIEPGARVDDGLTITDKRSLHLVFNRIVIEAIYALCGHIGTHAMAAGRNVGRAHNANVLLMKAKGEWQRARNHHPIKRAKPSVGMENLQVFHTFSSFLLFDLKVSLKRPIQVLGEDSIVVEIDYDHVLKQPDDILSPAAAERHLQESACPRVVARTDLSFISL